MFFLGDHPRGSVSSLDTIVAITSAFGAQWGRLGGSWSVVENFAAWKSGQLIPQDARSRLEVLFELAAEKFANLKPHFATSSWGRPPQAAVRVHRARCHPSRHYFE